MQTETISPAGAQTQMKALATEEDAQNGSTGLDVNDEPVPRPPSPVEIGAALIILLHALAVLAFLAVAMYRHPQ